MPDNGIRRYGPGKFDTILDSYVYAISGEGMGDQETGDVSEIGIFYESILLGPEALKRIEEIAAEEKDTLTEEEKELIRDSHGAILAENDQGFVSIDYYETEEEYDEDWENVENEVDSFYEESEEES